MGTFEHVILIFALISTSSFFAISEISLAASRKIRLQVYANEGKKNAQMVLALQENPGNFFTLIQIGLNAVAILGGVVGEQVFTAQIESLLSQFFEGSWIENVSFILSVSFITSLYILFADLIPRRLAMIAPESIALKIVKPMTILIALFKPVVWLFDTICNIIFRLFEVSTIRQDEIIPEDIVAMMEAGEQAGVLQSHEHQLIGNVLGLESRTVASAMTARESLIYISSKDSQEDVKNKLEKNPHLKFLVVNEDLDHVLGYVDSCDLLMEVIHNKEINVNKEGLLKPTLMIPISLNLYEVLEQFKTAGNDFGVVLNEYSLVMGVITLKDVMSIVMGQLVRYKDDQIIQRDANSWLMDGSTPFSDVMRMLDIKEFPDSESYETIAGFMMYMLRKIPQRTDFVVHAGYKFEVVDTDNYKIDQLLVTMV